MAVFRVSTICAVVIVCFVLTGITCDDGIIIVIVCMINYVVIVLGEFCATIYVNV